MDGGFVALFDGGPYGRDVLGLQYDLPVVRGVSFAYARGKHIGIAVA